jgi:hypothetical protein
MPCQSPARQQGSPGRLEVFGRYFVGHGFGGDIRWPQVDGLVAENVGTVAAVPQRRAIDQPHRFNAGNRLQGIDQALLHGRHFAAAVTAHREIGADQHGIPRFETEIDAQGAQQSPHADQ